MARKFGLVKKDLTFKQWSEQLERTIRAGQVIHQAHLQENHNRQLNIKKGQEESGSISWSDIVNNETPEESE